MAAPLVAFVTALPLEATAIRNVADIEWDLEATRSRVTVSRGVLMVDAAPVKVALVITGPGNAAAASVMQELMDEWPGTYFVFVGVAGGRNKELRLGDVVVANRVYLPMQGKEEKERFRPRSSAPELTRDMLLLVEQVVAAGHWAASAPKSGERPPRAFVKPIASSDVIDNSGEGQLELRIAERFDDAYAVETEGYGFLSELAASSRRGVLVRGISDMRAGKSGAADAVAQPLVAEIAAALALEIVKAGVRTEVIARPAWSNAAERLIAVVGAAGDVPVPGAVIALDLAAGGLDADAVIEEALASGKLTVSEQQGVALVRFTRAPAPVALPIADLGVAIDALLRQSDDPRTCRLFLAAANALAAKLVTVAPQRVISFFDTVEKAAKRAGSLRLVFDAASITIAASRRHSRDPAAVKAEAKALICGTSWVYQRTGMLQEALADGLHSLELGMQVNWHRNTFYCEKCLGRLHRMQAESATGQERDKHLQMSVQRLERAIAGFEQLEGFGPGHEEIGDCNSLLGRTYLVMGDRSRARKRADVAAALLIDSHGKDALDLEILLAELDVMDGVLDSARARLTPIANSNVDTLEQSEIVARALIVLAHVAAAGSDRAAADECLNRAATIAAAEDLQLLAAAIICEREELTPTLLRLLRDALYAHSLRVRAAGIRLYAEDLARQGRPVAARQRDRVERPYINRVLRRAQEIAAVENLRW